MNAWLWAGVVYLAVNLFAVPPSGAAGLAGRLLGGAVVLVVLRGASAAVGAGGGPA